MDARLSDEQRELRAAAAKLADDLGPGSVLELQTRDHSERTEATVAATGWRLLRSEGAGGVEIALVAEELARGLVDAPFLGPVLADALHPGPKATIATGGRAFDARGFANGVCLDDGDIVVGPLGEATAGADLTRRVAVATGEWETAGRLSADDAARWHALAIVLTAADLLGAARGAHALAVEYAKIRSQYGHAIGGYQAVSHPLAEGLALIEGMTSITRYAAWAVDAETPAEALRLARTAKLYCARSARDVCETAIQTHGGIGNTWECLAHVYLRRVLTATELFRARIEEVALDMDYRDSAEEAAFRARLRDWLATRAGDFAGMSGDEYWTRYGEWHQALYAAGFFGLSWPSEYGGQDLPPVYDVILDEELASAGAPPRPSLGYLVHGFGAHASEETRQRFLPGMINGTERWCQGFSEPGAGSDLACLATTAVPDGDDYVVNGHKIWTSYSDVADWCLLLARTDTAVPRHKGISAFVIDMHQPGIEQRPLKMISGVSTEFGQVLFDGARVPAANMVGVPGGGWALAMTVVSHEREPSTLGFTARYGKTVKQLEERADTRGGGTCDADLAWARIETEMLYAHVRRRLSEQLDGLKLSPPGGTTPRTPRASSDGSLDKLLMTWTEQTVGHAALSVAGTSDPGLLETYMYSRAQSVMGGTAQIQKNIIAGRILGLG